MTSLSATLTTRPDGNTQESLSLNATAAAAATANGLAVTYTQTTGVLLITGSATKAIYETILKGIQYQDQKSASTNTNGDRTVDIVVSDGALNSATTHVTIGVAYPAGVAGSPISLGLKTPLITLESLP